MPEFVLNLAENKCQPELRLHLIQPISTQMECQLYRKARSSLDAHTEPFLTIDLSR